MAKSFYALKNEMGNLVKNRPRLDPLCRSGPIGESVGAGAVGASIGTASVKDYLSNN